MAAPSTADAQSASRAAAAEAALRAAVAAGVEICFANPGTTELAFVEALDRVPEIRAVLGLFEGVCTGAADGYGRMRGTPALTLLHLGPGFANGIANLHNARRAHTPIVNLIGDQASWHRELDAPLTSDIESLATPVSHWLRTNTAAGSLPEDVAAAIEAAKGPPAGVATLIIPSDYQRGAADPARAPTRPLEAATASATLRVDAVAKRLRGAESIVFLLGASGLGEAGQLAAAKLSKATGARLLAETFPARWERGAGLPAIERLPYFPEQARAALGPADCIVLAGARAPVGFFGYEGIESRLANDEQLVLLSEPTEDAAAALVGLAETIGGPGTVIQRACLDHPAISGPLDPVAIGTALARHLPEQAIVMEEAATSSLPFYPASVSAPRHTLLSLTGGAIGQGLPCATGAALACPDRKVIAFQADGSAMYTFQSLWTQAHENLDVVTLLCSNRAYRILQVEMQRAGVAELGPQAQRLMQLDQPELDWVSLAKGCGVEAVRVSTGEELESALPRALEAGGPQLIEMVIG